MSQNNQTAPSHTGGWILLLLYLVAAVLGVANGLWGGPAGHTAADFISTLFIRLFKFVAVPIIAVSVISTLANLTASGNSGRLFKHTIFYTLLTTVLAATLAAVLYELFAPANVAVTGAAPAAVVNAGGDSYLKYLESVIPDNILAPFLSANVLSVLLIAAAVGLAIAKMPEGESRKVLLAFFTGLQDVLFRIVGWVIKVLPIGIFGFVSVLAKDLASGIELGGLGTYFTVVLTANLVQMFVVLPLVLLARGRNPIKVARAMLPALTVAFFSKSSAGTLPVTMTSAENRLGIRRQTPLRATHLHHDQHERVRGLHPSHRGLPHAERGSGHHLGNACRMDSHCDRGGRGERRRADGVLLSLSVAFGEHERPHPPHGRHPSLLRRH